MANLTAAQLRDWQHIPPPTGVPAGTPNWPGLRDPFGAHIGDPRYGYKPGSKMALGDTSKALNPSEILPLLTFGGLAGGAALGGAGVIGAEEAAGGGAAGGGVAAALKGAGKKAASKAGGAVAKDAGKIAAGLTIGGLFSNIGLWKGVGMVIAGGILILIGILNLAGVDPGGIGSTARRVVG